MDSADVVIVGGGANGTSTAFHLTRLGARNVLLLERRWLGAGATGKSGALVRMHYTNEHESRLALESLKVFQNFDAEVGGDCGFGPVGFSSRSGSPSASCPTGSRSRSSAGRRAWSGKIPPSSTRSTSPGCAPKAAPRR